MRTETPDASQQRYRASFHVDHRFNWTPPSSYKLWVFERNPNRT